MSIWNGYYLLVHHDFLRLLARQYVHLPPIQKTWQGKLSFIFSFFLFMKCKFKLHPPDLQKFLVIHDYLAFPEKK